MLQVQRLLLPILLFWTLSGCALMSGMTSEEVPPKPTASERDKAVCDAWFELRINQNFDGTQLYGEDTVETARQDARLNAARDKYCPNTSTAK